MMNGCCHHPRDKEISIHRDPKWGRFRMMATDPMHDNENLSTEGLVNNYKILRGENL